MNSSGALLLFIERMPDLATLEIQSTQQFLFMTSCIVITLIDQRHCCCSFDLTRSINKCLISNSCPSWPVCC